MLRKHWPRLGHTVGFWMLVLPLLRSHVVTMPHLTSTLTLATVRSQLRSLRNTKTRNKTTSSTQCTQVARYCRIASNAVVANQEMCQLPRRSLN